MELVGAGLAPGLLMLISSPELLFCGARSAKVVKRHGPEAEYAAHSLYGKRPAGRATVSFC